MPLDVGRLQPKQFVAKPNVVVAHGASTLIGAQDGDAKVRITCDGGIPYHPVEPEPNRGTNVVVE